MRWAWKKATARLGGIDRGFAVLRALIILIGLGWLLLSPVTPGLRYVFSWLFAGFCIYSVVLYAMLLSFPQRVREVYLVGLLVDAVCLFWVVHLTGGVYSDFLLGFYLMVALHSFYYGWRLCCVWLLI